MVEVWVWAAGLGVGHCVRDFTPSGLGPGGGKQGGHYDPYSHISFRGTVGGSSGANLSSPNEGMKVPSGPELIS